MNFQEKSEKSNFFDSCTENFKFVDSFGLRSKFVEKPLLFRIVNNVEIQETWEVNPPKAESLYNKENQSIIKETLLIID